MGCRQGVAKWPVRLLSRDVRKRMFENYALGGGRSGAGPDVVGMLTISAMALLAVAAPHDANPSACAAPSAVTQGMPVTHVACAGLEHGA